MKEYEPRRHFTNVCECGHNMLFHESGFCNIFSGKCYFCMCPKYKFERKEEIPRGSLKA